MPLPASFSLTESDTVEATGGQIAHREHIAHGERLGRRLYDVAPGVWCLVGNGLSNQTFVEGPDGLIAIDTGECVEEMASALAEIRTRTDAPVVAVIYSHFHYVAGTTALAAETSVDELPIWGHAGIEGNRHRAMSAVSPAYGRGLVHQFGISLPPDGSDGLLNVGLGMAYRSADHAPFTPGFVAPTHTFDAPTEATIAGLRVEMTPAPSDADDSVTIWFPDLDVCVNNLLWPALFNVFAIRGEEYRDPQVLLTGLDHMASLRPEHCVGAHGPPLSGRDMVASEIRTYRDSIQFMWDQTVRGLNRGLTSTELAEFVQLPECFGQTYLTSQLYGVAEHHVRQIQTGLFGWFDGDESRLFPLPAADRCARLVEGFGGADRVRTIVTESIDADDLRWALELASWLVRRDIGRDGRADGGTTHDRALLGRVLRTIAQRTTSANVRNWCLTRALELDGELDLSRLRSHRFSPRAVAAAPVDSVATLRVLVDPSAAAGVDDELSFVFGDQTAGLHVRNCVAVSTSGDAAEVSVIVDGAVWGTILGGRATLADALDSGEAELVGDRSRAAAVLACFDVPSLQISR